MPTQRHPADDERDEPPTVELDGDDLDDAAEGIWAGDASSKRRGTRAVWADESQDDVWSAISPSVDDAADANGADASDAHDPWVQEPALDEVVELDAAGDDAADESDEPEFDADEGAQPVLDADEDPARWAVVDERAVGGSAASAEDVELAGDEDHAGDTEFEEAAEPADSVAADDPTELIEPTERTEPIEQVAPDQPVDDTAASVFPAAMAAPAARVFPRAVAGAGDPAASSPSSPAAGSPSAGSPAPSAGSPAPSAASPIESPASAVESPASPATPAEPDPAPTTGEPVSAADPATPVKRERPGTILGAFELLGPHVREHRPALITGVVLGVLSIWLLLAIPFPIQHAVDAVTGSEPSGNLTSAMIVLAAIVAVVSVTTLGTVSAFGRVGARVATTLRGRLLGHLHGLDPATDGDRTSAADPALPATDRAQPAEQASQPLIDDVGRLRDLLSYYGPRIGAGLLGFAITLVVLLIVEPLAAAVVAATGILYLLLARFLMRGARAAQRHATAEDVTLADTAGELVAATRTVQSYGLEEHSQRTLSEVGARAGQARAAARRAEAGKRLFTHVMTVVGVGAMLLVVGPHVATGAASPGALVLGLVYLLISMGLLCEVAQHTGALTSTAEAGDRISGLLEEQGSIPQPQRAQALGRVRGEIVYSAISATGPRGYQLFDSVSLVIPEGQHVALMDREGTESSALLSYLQRFDQPDMGRVLLDRYDTRAVSLPELRCQIAVVQREPALFTDTVRENIRVGNPDASDDEVLQAARSAGIDALIRSLPDGYDTRLTQRGVALTDGQRRRLAVARALLRDAPIIVLDDADADLAPGERADVLAALAVLIEGRTAVIAGRDVETLAAADRILWFEGGVIVEDASPEALAADPDSHYAGWLRTVDDNGG